MAGGCTVVLILAVVISIGFLDGIPRDHLTVNVNSNELPKDTCSADWLQQNQGIRLEGAIKKHRIIGGTDVKNWETWPWIASLQVQKLGGYIACGGVLISCEHIVTALHCIDNNDEEEGLKVVPPNDVSIFMGSTTLMDGIVQFKARVLYYKDSGYQPNSEIPQDDIAVIQMNGKIDPVTKIRPILLPIMNMPTIEDEDQKKRSTNLWMAGWGNTITGITSATKKGSVEGLTPEPTTKLRQTNGLKVRPGSVCKNVDPFFNQFDETDICIESFLRPQIAATCVGDSGSPGMVENDRKWYLQAINSFGYGNCTTNRFSGFVNVFYYKNDIIKIIQGSQPQEWSTIYTN